MCASNALPQNHRPRAINLRAERGLICIPCNGAGSGIYRPQVPLQPLISQWGGGSARMVPSDTLICMELGVKYCHLLTAKN